MTFRKKEVEPWQVYLQWFVPSQIKERLLAKKWQNVDICSIQVIRTWMFIRSFSTLHVHKTFHIFKKGSEGGRKGREDPRRKCGWGSRSCWVSIEEIRCVYWKVLWKQTEGITRTMAHTFQLPLFMCFSTDVGPLSSGCSQPIEETGQQPHNTTQAMEEGLARPQSSELDLKLWPGCDICPSY